MECDINEFGGENMSIKDLVTYIAGAATIITLWAYKDFYTAKAGLTQRHVNGRQELVMHDYKGGHDYLICKDSSGKPASIKEYKPGITCEPTENRK